ncbi:MAG: trehalase family glycosidase [Candidatus Saccharimonadales bacterium]|nr:trehalase family glycosidase [Candidatus Saccharimonadales bacterium]
MRKTTLINKAKRVLKDNDLGGWTRPAPDLYPHQWLWDSAFISIGIAWYDAERARKELLSLIRGQWSNGMLPHMIFDEESGRFTGANVWRSEISPAAPPGIETSGITQPPILAEAVWRVGEHMNKEDRHVFFSEMFAALLRYHGWLYRERDPHNEGLVVMVHPWETGLDNTPPWLEEMRHNQTPIWIRVIDRLKLDRLFKLFRQDTKLVPASERISTVVALTLFHAQRRLRRKKYNSMEILRRAHFSIDDVFYNAVLIRNNHILEEIAHEIGESIPADLRESFEKAKEGLEQLWCAEDQRYYSRNFITKEWIREPYIGSLAPLYSGAVTKRRAAKIVEHLTDELHFWTKYPIPSVPLSSSYFNHMRYWQGPTWINTNWLIIDGLKQYGYHKEAALIKEQTIKLVEKHGFCEYFSPIDGSPSGAQSFSWTAALIIDLLSDD